MQEKAANHRQVRRLRAEVLSVTEKADVGVRQVRARKASESEPLMTCRKFMDDIETGCAIHARDESGGDLCVGLAVSGIKMARAWSGLWCGTWEPVASTTCGQVSSGHREGERQGAETPRCGVPVRGTGADRPVVAVKPRNGGRAKGAGHPGLFGGQPQRCGRNR